MTPIRPLPSSLLPSRLQDAGAISRQRYLVARILEGAQPSLSNPQFEGFSIAQRLALLPENQRSRIEEQAGGSLRSLTSISEETVPEYFYEGIYQAGLGAENQDHFEVAQSCYFFLSRLNEAESPVPPHLRAQARARLELLGGGGSSWDRLEFGLRRLPRQTLDPAFLVGMGAASLVGRGLRLGLLARAARSGGVSNRFLPRLFDAGIVATAESLFFVGAERGTASLLGQPASSASLPEEWLRYGLPMFLGSRLLGTVSGQLYRRRLTDGSLAGASFRQRLGYGLATQASILGAAYLTQNLESSESAAERRPHDAIAHALLWTLSFSAFNSATRRIGGTRSIAWERGLFR